MEPSLHLRPMHASDEAFLRQVYASTRAGEIALTGWDERAAEAFLRMQFDAQHHHYRQHYATARFDIVERDGVAIGRLYVARTPSGMRVIDIALLDEFRGQGIGTTLLSALLEEAAAAGSNVSLQVEDTNPALTLYHRLGFRQIDASGLYRRMEWRAPDTTSTSREPS